MSELIQTINTDEDRKTAKEQLNFTYLLKEDSGGIILIQKIKIYFFPNRLLKYGTMINIYIDLVED